VCVADEPVDVVLAATEELPDADEGDDDEAGAPYCATASAGTRRVERKRADVVNVFMMADVFRC